MTEPSDPTPVPPQRAADPDLGTAAGPEWAQQEVGFMFPYGAPTRHPEWTRSAVADRPVDQAPPAGGAAQDAPPVTIQRYRPRIGPLPMALIAVVLTALVGLAVIGPRLGTNSTSAPSSSAPSVLPSQPLHSAPAGTQGIEVVSERDAASGYWLILSELWTSSGLRLEMQVYADQGTLDFTFFALDNQSAQIVEPESASTLASGTVAQGRSVEGTVIFTKTRGDTTVIITDSTGRQVTALVVKG